MHLIALCFVILGFSISAAAQEPSPLPSGEIAFVSTRNGDHQIYVMDADGTNIRQLTNGNYESFQPIWSPDGQKIAFMREVEPNDQDNTPLALWVMDADGSHAIEIAQEREGESISTLDEFLRWSPDSQRLLYRRYYDFQNMELILVGADGTNAQTLTPEVGILGLAYFLTNESLVILDSDHTEHVLRYDLVDGKITPLTGYDVPIKPSPDGTQLALMDSKSLVVVDVSTGEKRVIQQKLLGLDPGEEARYAALLYWSADSSIIAGIMQTADTSHLRARDLLFVTRVDGTGYTVFEVANPVFSLSPDGEYIVYSTRIPYVWPSKEVGYHMTIARTDGDGTPILFAKEQTHSQPSWRPVP